MNDTTVTGTDSAENLKPSHLRLSTKLVISHLAVAVVAIGASFLMVKALSPQVFARMTHMSGMGRGRRAMLEEGGYVGQVGPLGPAPQSMGAAFTSAINIGLIWGLVLAVGVALLLSLLAVRQLLCSFRSLSRTTRLLAAGQYQEHISPPREPELAKLAADINGLGAALAQTEQRRTQLLSEVAHEMRTPLTVLEGNLEGIQDGVFSLDAERIATMQAEIARLQDLSQDFSMLSRSEEGRWDLDCKPVEISRIVKESVERFREAVKAKGIDLRVEDEAPRTTLNADEKRLVQVFSNLLNNALRATPREGLSQSRRQQLPHLLERTVQILFQQVLPRSLPVTAGSPSVSPTPVLD